MSLPEKLEKQLRELAADKFYGIGDAVLDTVLQSVTGSETVRIEGHLPAAHPLIVKLTEIAYSDESKRLMAKCDLKKFDVRYTFVYDEHEQSAYLITEADQYYGQQYPSMLGNDLNNYLEVSNVSLGFGRPSLLEEPEFQKLFVFYLQDHDMLCAEDDITEEFIRCDDRAKRAAISALYELASKYGIYGNVDLFADARHYLKVN